MVPLVFATVALAPALIRIFFSDAYLSAALAMRILAVYALIISLDMAYVTVIYGVDRPDVSLRLGLATASVTIASFFILIPPDIYGIKLLGGGATGAAMALLLGGIAEYSVSRHYAKKVAGVASCNRVWIHVACGAVMAIFLFACGWAGLVTRWYSLLAVCAAGLAMYAGLLVACREFGRRDVDFFIDLLNLRKMFAYLSFELRGKK
jgi:O-antigen/teichoic acid export membrane protein